MQNHKLTEVLKKCYKGRSRSSSKPAITCLKLIKTLEQGVKYVQS